MSEHAPKMLTIPADVLRVKLAPKLQKLLIALSSYCPDGVETAVSQRDIRELTGLAFDSIIKYVNMLQNCGLVRVSSDGYRNRYAVDYHRLRLAVENGERLLPGKGGRTSRKNSERVTGGQLEQVEHAPKQPGSVEIVATDRTGPVIVPATEQCAVLPDEQAKKRGCAPVKDAPNPQKLDDRNSCIGSPNNITIEHTLFGDAEKHAPKLKRGKRQLAPELRAKRGVFEDIFKGFYLERFGFVPILTGKEKGKQAGSLTNLVRELDDPEVFRDILLFAMLDPYIKSNFLPSNILINLNRIQQMKKAVESDAVGEIVAYFERHVVGTITNHEHRVLQLLEAYFLLTTKTADEIRAAIDVARDDTFWKEAFQSLRQLPKVFEARLDRINARLEAQRKKTQTVVKEPEKTVMPLAAPEDIRSITAALRGLKAEQPAPEGAL